MNLFYRLKKIGELFFYFILKYNLKNCKTVLDVGCGYNSALRYINLPIKKEGIDIFNKNIEISKKHKIHQKYRVGDIRKLNKYYKSKSFDAVVCIDVIEHLTKKEGFVLIEMMEQIAKKKVMILTPVGFYSQDDINDNPYQIHKSGWLTEDFKQLGYKVYGLRGLRLLRDDFASIRFKPWILWGFLSFVSELLLYKLPDVSFDMLAVKQK
ncbi:class I SAM-dependent methyltransferase [Patescibacteria group bacterium]